MCDRRMYLYSQWYFVAHTAQHSVNWEINFTAASRFYFYTCVVIVIFVSLHYEYDCWIPTLQVIEQPKPHEWQKCKTTASESVFDFWAWHACSLTSGLHHNNYCRTLNCHVPFLFHKLNKTTKLQGVNIDTVPTIIGITHVLELCGLNLTK